MSETTRGGRGTHPNRRDTALHPDVSVIDWWTHPALAYWQGLQDGARLAEEEAMRGWPMAVRSAARLIEQAERRRAFDLGIAP